MISQGWTNRPANAGTGYRRRTKNDNCMKLILSPLEKTVALLDAALKFFGSSGAPAGSAEREMLRDAVIQRMGFEQGLLKDPEAWFEYLDKRNLTSHTYNPLAAEQVFACAGSFLQDAQFLLARLEEKTK